MESCRILWFGMYRQAGENRRHTHPFFQMLAVSAGSGTATVGDVSAEVGAGCLCLIGPDQPHSVDCDGQALSIRDVKFMVSDSQLTADLRRHTGCTVPADFHPYLACFEDIAQETLGARAYYRPMIELRLFEMLVRICRENGVAAPAADMPAPCGDAGAGGPLAPLLAYIRENHRQPLGLGKLCAVAGMNRTSLTALFRARLQVTPIRYLTIVRLQHAKSLLARTDMTVCEIADACGFQSEHYFCRTFKRLEGCTPMQYRRAHSGCHYFSYE